MRSGECARASEMTATAMKTANVNATAATMEATAASTVKTTTMKATAAPTVKATATAAVTTAFRAGIRRSRQQYRATKRDHA
jgi:hypothetical protein